MRDNAFRHAEFTDVLAEMLRRGLSVRTEEIPMEPERGHQARRSLSRRISIAGDMRS